MQSILTPVLAVLIGGLTAPACLAEWSFIDAGGWPGSWPAELESLRPQSRTLLGVGDTIYVIPFSDRAEFEAAWPHLLAMATDGSPLTLSRGHDAVNAFDINAGVVVLTPNTPELIGIDESGIDAIGDESRKLPTFVVPDGPKWRAITIEEMRKDRNLARRARRLRTEVRLVVDGKIVDLNRIPLPALAIDKRFNED
jgi:hypothetical protein